MNTHTSQSGLTFMKMHGLGNDFVILDCRGRHDPMTAVLAAALGDRHCGVGFDQLAVIIDDYEAEAALVFYNADGSVAGACGNATRCVARHLMQETGVHTLSLRTERGILICEDAGEGLTRVNMGQPFLNWAEIPLVREMDTLHLPIEGAPTATGMGNPHCTFFVEDVAAIDLDAFGAAHVRSALFPEGTNVQVVQKIGPDHLRMRVYERGVGITLASGSSSCATGVAAARRGVTGRKVRIDMDGGPIWVDWRADGVWMTGATAHVFTGTLTDAFLNSVTQS